ncbi:DUF4062 domain-containing protein [Metabacillus fastidiosus]|uniref:DUF4062 domain-containing protein n=1 Tax=Metabacillus fastidiosus TaxID=1458 RepID=UPI003D2E1127
MATPRVFVSSTCFDLSEIRDSLDSFIKSYNFIPVMSDKGDVFYNPDLHTHDACLKEVESCQLFILIIGGRFGGEYYKDKDKNGDSPSKSITNLEYLTAKACNIPIFAFVKRNVMENHLFHKDNQRHNPQSDSIYYSAIDKQEYAKNIFEFIDEVRLSTENNAFFSFDYGKEIHEMLGKQWAGMIYDFLIDRQRQKEVAATNKLIENLTIATEKTEELLKKLLMEELGDSANQAIEDINKEANAKRFFKEVFEYFNVSYNMIKGVVQDYLDINNQVNKSTIWHEFLVKSHRFKYNTEIYTSEIAGEKHTLALEDIKGRRIIILETNFPSEFYINKCKEFEEHFDSFRSLDEVMREKVLKSLI